MKGKACLCSGPRKYLVTRPPLVNTRRPNCPATTRRLQLHRGKSPWLINQTCFRCVSRQGCATGGVGFRMCELSPSRDWETKSSIFPHEVLPVANDRFEDNLTDRNICGRAHPHSARARVCVWLSWKPGLNPQRPHPPHPLKAAAAINSC